MMETIHVPEWVLPLDDLAKALGLSSIEVLKEFRDSRLTGRLAEVWGTRLFGYKKHANSNFPGSDASIMIGPIGHYRISVRSFYKRLQFQQSKFMGKGRKCTQENLLESLEKVEVVVAVDLREFPRLLFYPLNSKWLLRLAREGSLSPSGMTAARFDKWIADSFEVHVVPANTDAT